MASIARDKNGCRRILFVAPNGKRPTIRLGKVSQRAAESVRYRVEQLLEAITLNRPMDAELAQWVSSLEPRLAKRLAAVGLIRQVVAKPVATLGPFLTTYIAGRADLKSATKVVRGVVIRDLTEFFGDARVVDTINPGNADDFKQWLVSRKLAPTTIHKRLQVARSFFHAMRRRKLIVENPFEGVSAPATGIKDRQRFVTRDETARVLAACPTHHWRTIIALSRYGGLRNPSETLSLRWQDIDWEAGRIVVTSPKTEHHPGAASRTIPLFPELRPILSEAFELAPEGAVYVVDEKYRQAAMGPAGWMNANLRTTLLKIIRRAGLQPWPRPFHNLRASRETELVEKYPVQVVTSWLGNTPTVAMRHYLMTTNEHFESAVQGDGLRPADQAPQAAQKAAQKAAQQAHVLTRGESQGGVTAHEKTPVLPGFASDCGSARTARIVRRNRLSSGQAGYDVFRCRCARRKGNVSARTGVLSVISEFERVIWRRDACGGTGRVCGRRCLAILVGEMLADLLWTGVEYRVHRGWSVFDPACAASCRAGSGLLGGWLKTGSAEGEERCLPRESPRIPSRILRRRRVRRRVVTVAWRTPAPFRCGISTARFNCM